jgi:hypothetical protein
MDDWGIWGLNLCVMKTKLALLLMFAVLTAAANFSYAEDLTTLDGKAFTNITEITKYPAQMVFTYSGKRTSVSISNLPADFRTKHPAVSEFVTSKPGINTLQG